MQQRVKQLIRQLISYGYCSFQVEIIMKDAIGSDSVHDLTADQEAELVKQLEKYEQLGSEYLYAYSK